MDIRVKDSRHSASNFCQFSSSWLIHVLFILHLVIESLFTVYIVELFETVSEQESSKGKAVGFVGV